ncbi:MAG: sulfite oxidase-like oxidoreductase [bacterium]|jgi:DMSO/TMAO reductase YedYZ molybdopterin-dependent catalytic subunit
MLFQTTDPKLQSGEPPVPETQPNDVLISPDTRRENRIPRNQARTKKWPVLDAGGPPDDLNLKNLSDWRLNLFGLIEEPLTFTWEDFKKLPRMRVFADMHCVTRWSRLGNIWEGVSTREVLSRIKLKSDAKFVMVHAYDKGFSFAGGRTNWTTNLPLEWFLDEDCLFADTHDGLPISLEHGGPLRLVVPRLYAWKSAKWVSGVEFRADDAPGFWERGGYHMLGDPWKEQRYRFSEEEDEDDDAATSI